VPSGAGKIHKAHEWLFRETWLTPDAYEGIDDANKRAILQQAYPDGLLATKVNDTWVLWRNEDKCDVWTVCKTGKGDYIMENPIAHDKIPFQKATNDLFGLAVETILRAIPKTLVDSGLID